MTAPLVAVDRLTVERGGRPVVRDLSLVIRPGEVVLLIGHNGSGKSSLLHALAGLLPAQAGEIRWRGPRGRRRQAIMLQDGATFLSRSVTENVAAGVLGRFKLGPTRRRALEDRLSAAVPELTSKLQTPCADLSGGQRQLVGLGRTMLTDADLLLFDEPTVGLPLDVASRALGTLCASLAGLGSAALIVEHNIDIAAKFATRLCVMKDGELVYDGTLALLADRSKLRDVYL